VSEPNDELTVCEPEIQLCNQPIQNQSKLQFTQALEYHYLVDSIDELRAQFHSQISANRIIRGFFWVDDTIKAKV
jgi:tRNA A37 threonylcarbamoyladenosine dehydratase